MSLPAPVPIFYSPRALADRDRLFDFLALENPAAAGRGPAVIVDAFTILVRHPFIGRPVRSELRELLIAHGRSGDVALYRPALIRNRIEVLALRQRRETGFRT